MHFGPEALPPALHKQLELWAGAECTVNRVGNSFLDQLESTGHASRELDLELIANLRPQAIRFPVLWERTNRLGSKEWSRTDRSLNKIREMGIRPIIGLVHHGSGPPHTNLLDPEFPTKLAAYAAQVAKRYPWIRDFTPVNEPLTTARFSGLYGHWYPHGKSDHEFATALLNQCKAIVLAMAAIREVTPEARLIQTEDLGRIAATPLLQYQADFENERRWVSLDLLCGRLDQNTTMWRYLRERGGLTERELSFFRQNPSPPAIAGFNYYLTSERFLHEDTRHYPPQCRGGNGTHQYADVECARVRKEGIFGAEYLLREAWERFELPLAITECHNGCTREEQIRWVADVWNDCLAAQERGVDLRAFTAWSLFGATDWDSLCTIRRNHYEPGVYDVRGPKPRATALAKIFKQISESQSVSHPFLDTPGWWRRSERHSHGFCISPCGSVQRVHPSTLVVHSTGAATRAAASALLVINPTGVIGGGLRRECQGRALRFHEVELGDHAKSSDLLRTVRELQPWAIVNASEHPDPLLCAMIARICKQRRLASVAFSSYLVFDGGKPGPYIESDPIHPRDPAGARYAIAEEEIFAGYPETLLLRTGELLGRQDGADESHSTGQSIRSRLLPDEFSITYIPDLVRNALDLLIDGEIGIWHLANPGTVTSEELVELQPSAAHQTLAIDHHATRPASLVLASEKAWLLPTAHSAIERYLDSLPEGLEEAAA